jgi:hypothetical protein
MSTQYNGFIYQWTNQTNNKKYIGITKQDLKKRLYGYKYGHKYEKRPIAYAIKKYGYDNFDIEYEMVDDGELLKKETEKILGILAKAFLTGNATYIPQDIRRAHVCYSLKITYTELMKQPSWFINDYLLILEAKNRVESGMIKRQQSQLQQKRPSRIR